MTTFLARYRRTPDQRAKDRAIIKRSDDLQVALLLSMRVRIDLPPLSTTLCPTCGYDRRIAGACAFCGVK